MLVRNVLLLLVVALMDILKRCRSLSEKPLLSMRRRSLSKICPTVWIVERKVRRRGRKIPSSTRYGISATQWFRRFNFLSGRAYSHRQGTFCCWPSFRGCYSKRSSLSKQLAPRPKKRRRVVEDNSDEDLPAPSSSSVLEDGLYCLPHKPLSPDIAAAAIVNAQEEDEEEDEEFLFFT